MADLSITAASVVQTDGGVVDGIAGATITAGQVVYLDVTDDRFKLAKHDSTLALATVRGIALHGASSGQPLRVQTGGRLNPGATVAVGQIYCASNTAGAICPYADLGTGDYVSILGVATLAAELTLQIFNSGVQKA